VIAGMDELDQLLEYSYGAQFADLDRQLQTAALDYGAIRRLLEPFRPVGELS